MCDRGMIGQKESHSRSNAAANECSVGDVGAASSASAALLHAADPLPMSFALQAAACPLIGGYRQQQRSADYSSVVDDASPPSRIRIDGDARFVGPSSSHDMKKNDRRRKYDELDGVVGGGEGGGRALLSLSEQDDDGDPQDVDGAFTTPSMRGGGGFIVASCNPALIVAASRMKHSSSTDDGDWVHCDKPDSDGGEFDGAVADDDVGHTTGTSLRVASGTQSVVRSASRPSNSSIHSTSAASEGHSVMMAAGSSQQVVAAAAAPLYLNVSHVCRTTADRSRRQRDGQHRQLRRGGSSNTLLGSTISHTDRFSNATAETRRRNRYHLSGDEGEESDVAAASRTAATGAHKEGLDDDDDDDMGDGDCSVLRSSSQRWFFEPHREDQTETGAASRRRTPLMKGPSSYASSDRCNELDPPHKSSYSVIAFDLRLQCAAGDEYVMVKRFRDVLRRIAPRCRLQAYKERQSHADEALFDGVVQVVPMFTMLQVSLEPVVPVASLFQEPGKRDGVGSVGDDEREDGEGDPALSVGWFAYGVLVVAYNAKFWLVTVLCNMILFASLLTQQHVPEQRSSIWSAASIVAVTSCIVSSLLLAIFVLSCSRQLLWLCLRSFDWWVIQFWMLLTVACNVLYTQRRYGIGQADDDHHDDSGSTAVMWICEGIGLVLSLEGTLILDAFPPLPRFWKGVLYLLTAGFSLMRYGNWFLAVRSDDFAADSNIDFGRFSLRLATVGQSASAALVAFFLRLAYRALRKKWDLQLIDFPVQLVPHIGDHRLARPSGAAAAAQARKEAATACGPSCSPALADRSKPSINATSSFSTATTLTGGVVCCNDAAEVSNHYGPSSSSGGEDASAGRLGMLPCDTADEHDDDAHRGDDNVQKEKKPHHRPEASSSPRASSTGRGDDDCIEWLHFQGSLPCLPHMVQRTCRLLRKELLKQSEATERPSGTYPPAARSPPQHHLLHQKRKLTLAVVDHSHAFDCDRRTFEPECLMHSFSPKPLIPIPLVFRGLSTVYWTRLGMLSVVLGSALQVLINVYDKGDLISIAAVQSFLFGIATMELLFGVSTALVRHMLTTLDFWYVVVVFASQIASGVVVYQSDYNVALAVLHTLMVCSTALFVSTMDAIVLTTFDGFVKGVIAATLSGYCLLDLVWFTPAEIASKPHLFNQSIDLRVAVVSPGSVALLANMACFLVFFRVAGRTLWMGSRLVFFQMGAREEPLSVMDAAVMAHMGRGAFPDGSPMPASRGMGGGSGSLGPDDDGQRSAPRTPRTPTGSQRGSDVATMLLPSAPSAAFWVGRPRSESRTSRGTGSRPFTSAHADYGSMSPKRGMEAATATSKGRLVESSLPSAAASRVSFFGGYLGDMGQQHHAPASVDGNVYSSSRPSSHAAAAMSSPPARRSDLRQIGVASGCDVVGGPSTAQWKASLVNVAGATLIDDDYDEDEDGH